MAYSAFPLVAYSLPSLRFFPSHVSREDPGLASQARRFLGCSFGPPRLSTTGSALRRRRNGESESPQASTPVSTRLRRRRQLIRIAQAALGKWSAAGETIVVVGRISGLYLLTAARPLALIPFPLTTLAQPNGLAATYEYYANPMHRPTTVVVYIDPYFEPINPFGSKFDEWYELTDQKRNSARYAICFSSSEVGSSHAPKCRPSCPQIRRQGEQGKVTSSFKPFKAAWATRSKASLKDLINANSMPTTTCCCQTSRSSGRFTPRPTGASSAASLKDDDGTGSFGEEYYLSRKAVRNLLRNGSAK